MNHKNIFYFICLIIIGSLFYSCTGKKQPSNLRENRASKSGPVTYEQAVKDWRTNKGVGPIKSVELGEIDPQLVEKGRGVFELNCTACHLPYQEKIGPAPVGITERRTPEWIMNMILNPEEMVKTDPICLGLLAQYNSVMANQNLDQEEARAILEYFRSLKIDNVNDPS